MAAKLLGNPNWSFYCVSRLFFLLGCGFTARPPNIFAAIFDDLYPPAAAAALAFGFATSSAFKRHFLSCGKYLSFLVLNPYNISVLERGYFDEVAILRFKKLSVGGKNLYGVYRVQNISCRVCVTSERRDLKKNIYTHIYIFI